jgi:hypothetical protein
VSERKAELRAYFWGKVCKLFAVDVCLMTRVRSQFSFALVFFRLLAEQKRGSLLSFVSLKIAAVLVDPVAPREWQCRGGEVYAVQSVSVVVLLVILA